MKKLVKYASSSEVMDLSFEWNNKTYSFNLDEELRISEENLNTSVKSHVRGYAFILMMHKKVSIRVDEMDQEKRRLINKLTDKYMQEFDNKVTAAKAKAESDNKVVEKQKSINRLAEIRDYLQVCVNSLSVRKDLLQTLAANTRQENKQ